MKKLWRTDEELCIHKWSPSGHLSSGHLSSGHHVGHRNGILEILGTPEFPRILKTFEVHKGDAGDEDEEGEDRDKREEGNERDKGEDH